MKKLNQIKENNVRSLIARDRQMVTFWRKYGLNDLRCVSPLIKNYDDVDAQEELTRTRAHDRNALRKEIAGRKLTEKDYFLNFATRDLVSKSGFELDADLITGFNLITELEIEDAAEDELQQPPPIKNTTLPTVNLAARLLPAPTFTSA